MEEWEISKKELLQETGISYGQLYRWKREGLIPEEWFAKRSAFTGQETFFPRERMLARVQTIIELKDDHSLEEIREKLNGTATARLTAANALSVLTGAETEDLQDTIDEFAELSLPLYTWTAVAAAWQAGSTAGLKGKALTELGKAALAAARELDTATSQASLAKAGDNYYVLLLANSGDFALAGLNSPEPAEVIASIQTDDIIEQARSRDTQLFAGFAASDRQAVKKSDLV